MREIVFDTETTGRDPLTGDRIVEIACVEIVNLLPTGATFHRYINPERDVPEEVVRIHGLTGAFLRDKPVFGSDEVLGPLLDFIGDSPLVAHNAEFDRKFFNAELIRLKLPAWEPDRFVDTLPIARSLFPGAANSLDALSRRFQLDRLGFDLSKRKGAGGHGALLDARMLAEVYLQLRGGRERKLELGDTDVRQASAAGEQPRFERRPQRARPLAPLLTALEAAAHAAFVADLGAGALWNAPESEVAA
jgi:DNA polymerase III subunit epsilon